MVKANNGYFKGKAISIPNQMFPGLAQALHLRLQHPSKLQLTNIMQRYFYCPGYAQIVSNVSENCQQCLALKTLPKTLLENTTTKVESFGSRFSVDIMERERQLIFVCRENLTQFTQLMILEDQSAKSLRLAVMSTIVPWIAEQGCYVRVDGAQAFLTLKAESEDKGSILYKYKIEIEVGRLNNPNKNTVAENCIKELEKEILRYDQDLRIMTEYDVIQIQKTINTRIREKGLSAQEKLLKRNMAANEDLAIKDSDLSTEQYELRMKRIKRLNERQRESEEEEDFRKGDLVYVRNAKTKHTAREIYIIVAVDDQMVEVKKLKSQLRNRTYRMFRCEIKKLPGNRW